MAEKPNRRSITTRIVIWTLIALFAIGVVLLVMDFVSKNQTGFEGKTLWDLMDLLIVPLVLGVGVFLLDTLEKRRQAEIDTRRADTDRKLAEQRAETDRELALERIQEDRLQAYLDQMTALLIKEGLRKSSEEDEVRQVARTRTLTVFRGLDGERKGALLRFLRESKLIDKDSPIISLSSADLSEAELSGASLSGASLNRANLSAADLPRANLFGADLRRANLSGAFLSGASLSGANLGQANLSGANLSGANLSGVNLSEARYDDATNWPDGFNPIAAGAKKVDQELPDENNIDKSGPTVSAAD
jgi:hypothetical protein